MEAAIEVEHKAASSSLRIRMNALGQLVVSQSAYPDRLRTLNYPEMKHERHWPSWSIRA
jgi:hypothetical protein